MRPTLRIEVFHGGRWHFAATVEAKRGAARTEPTWLEHDYDYAADHLGHRDQRAVSFRYPVDYQLHSLETRLGEQLAEAPSAMRALAVDDEIIERCTPHIQKVSDGLRRVR